MTAFTPLRIDAAGNRVPYDSPPTIEQLRSDLLNDTAIVVVGDSGVWALKRRRGGNATAGIDGVDPDIANLWLDVRAGDVDGLSIGYTTMGGLLAIASPAAMTAPNLDFIAFLKSPDGRLRLNCEQADRIIAGLGHFGVAPKGAWGFKAFFLEHPELSSPITNDEVRAGEKTIDELCDAYLHWRKRFDPPLRSLARRSFRR